MEHNDKNKSCQCLQCMIGKTAFAAHENAVMEKYGWLVHYVFDTNPYNIHTHGLPENFGQPDFQIFANLSQTTAHAILVDLFLRVKSGEKFETGKKYNDVLKGYDLKFELAKENDRIVLRLIFPGKDGKFEGEFYESQLTGIININ